MSYSRKKVAFHTLGCKLNFTETSTIARSLGEEKYERVPFDNPADIYVINTCSVTGAADRKCRQVIKKTASHNPDAIIVVAGCYAQLKPGEISSIRGVDLVLGTNEKFNLGAYIERIEGTSPGIVNLCEPVTSTHFTPSYSLADRTRSFLKVQDGCDYLCSYCTIPLARGGSRNQFISDCVSQAKEIASSGIKELVLTGVNIGDFGKSTGESFIDLLKELCNVEGIERIRISSIEPNLLTNEIIELVASNPKLLPHFHIPLQSGCNRTLARMKRRYTREVFADRVNMIRSIIPDAGIGADVIVGFPGETEEDFNSAREFLQDTNISYLHVFTFSPRENTPAASMDGQVKGETASQRSRMLHRLSEKKRLDFYRSCTGKRYNVLWESMDENGMISGFTENYIRVTAPGKEDISGKISPVTLLRMDENGNFTCQ